LHVGLDFSDAALNAATPEDDEGEEIVYYKGLVSFDAELGQPEEVGKRGRKSEEGRVDYGHGSDSKGQPLKRRRVEVVLRGKEERVRVSGGEEGVSDEQRIKPHPKPLHKATPSYQQLHLTEVLLIH